MPAWTKRVNQSLQALISDFMPVMPYESYRLSGEPQVFSDALTKQQRAQLEAIEGQQYHYAGESLFLEGQSSDYVYLIVEGQVDIYKSLLLPNGEQKTLQIASLGAGQLVGELGLIDSGLRSATVVAKTSLSLKAYSIEQLKQYAGLYCSVTRFIAVTLAKRLRHTNSLTVAALNKELDDAKAKNVLARFMVSILWPVAIYALLLTSLLSFKALLPDTTIISVIMIVIMAAVVLKAIYHTQLPLHLFGLVLSGQWRACRQAVLYTLPLMMAVLIAKYLAIIYLPAFSEVKLFDPSALYLWQGNFSWLIYFSSLLAYCLFAPAQELIIRSGIQSSLYLFLPGNERIRKWHSILLANMIFAAVHAHVSAAFAMTAFFSGLFWGAIFYQQRSWLAVSLSHLLLGVWVTFIVGVPGFLV